MDPARSHRRLARCVAETAKHSAGSDWLAAASCGCPSRCPASEQAETLPHKPSRARRRRDGDASSTRPHTLGPLEHSHRCGACS